MNSGDKLHILHLPAWYIPEGGYFCRDQVQALNENRDVYASVLANVTISIRKYGLMKAVGLPKRFFMSHEDDIDVYRNYHISLPFFKKIDNELWLRETMKMVESYIRKYGKPDVIHAHSALWTGVAAARIKEKHNIPYVITEHRGIFSLSCEWAENQFFEWQNPFLERAFSNADLIISVSEQLIPKIKTYLKRQVPFEVVSNLVKTDYFYYKPRQPQGGSVKAVMVNGFSKPKAYDILFTAIDKVMDTVDNLKLIIVGENFSGDEFDRLWSRVRHKDKISFSGELDESGVRDALWDSDFFIISSRVESQSVSTLEALSTGLPVVCTDVIPDYVANETNAIRVPVEDVEKLAGGITEMIGRYHTYDQEKIAENIKKIAGKDVVSEKLISIYRLITDKPDN